MTVIDFVEDKIQLHEWQKRLLEGLEDQLNGKKPRSLRTPCVTKARLVITERPDPKPE